jgi:hypothetical protein
LLGGGGGLALRGDEVLDLALRAFRLSLLLDLLVNLPPLLLGPAQLLDGRSQIEEVDRDDRSSGPQISIADERIEFSTGLNDSFVDGAKTFCLLGGVAMMGSGQAKLLVAGIPGGRGRGYRATSIGHKRTN